ncbi:expressed protein [Phakopsora pachyrhizi]|uniref:Expressed protein n=1 Tax=Phakopsora pachyrhizi TaxID=170000 RepID=A0AAV0B7Q2_PHAPC|nr:expressed protein [Phakopsora pachyrhizi]
MLANISVKSDQINEFLINYNNKKINGELSLKAVYSKEAKAISDQLENNVSNERQKYFDLIFHAFRHILNVPQHDLSDSNFLGWIKLFAVAGKAIENENDQPVVLLALKSGMNNLIHQNTFIDKRLHWVQGFLNSLNLILSEFGKEKIIATIKNVPGAREIFIPTMGVTSRMKNWESFKSFIKFDHKLHNILLSFSNVQKKRDSQILLESIQKSAEPSTGNSLESKTASLVFLHYIAQGWATNLTPNKKNLPDLKRKATEIFKVLSKNEQMRLYISDLLKRNDVSTNLKIFNF